MDRAGPHGSCVNKVLNYHIYIVSYLHCVERKDLHTVLCLAGYGASTVVRKLHSWLSVSGIMTPVTYGSGRHPEASKEMAVLYRSRRGIC
jgi:hypothetical protein